MNKSSENNVRGGPSQEKREPSQENSGLSEPEKIATNSLQGTAPWKKLGLRPIQMLPSELVNQIAAGEVVERPASVVKELIENALDAGATRLTVDLEDGGKGLIRIVDDGGGIAPEDLSLAVQNHATSKLRSLDDLFAIGSLGFRGEALASIASVSQFSLSSRRGEAEGAEIRVEGGRPEAVRAAGIPRGTRVEVRNLFFNVPARRKFLKTTRSELNAVTDQLTRLALSRPEVFISLRHDGKQVLSVPPADEPRERIARLTTQVIAQEIVAFGPRKGKRAPMEIRGYLSPFHLTRGDTRGQYFFLNGRSIRDRLLLKMVKDAYLHLLPPRRHPYIFLWLDVEPGDVDVNVHPTKAEVRFRRSSDVYALVLSTMKEALAGGRLAGGRVAEFLATRRTLSALVRPRLSSSACSGLKQRAQRQHLFRLDWAHLAQASRQPEVLEHRRW